MAPTRGLSGPPGPGAGRPHRAPRKLRWLLAGLLLVPLLEIVVVIAVGQRLGPWATFALLLALSAIGGLLVRREGRRTWTALREAVDSGRTPARELADAILVLVGGVLLLTPGFLTGAVGLFLMLPVTRPLTRRWLEALIGSRILGAMPGGSYPGGPRPRRGTRGPSGRPAKDDVIEGEIVDDRPPTDP